MLGQLARWRNAASPALACLNASGCNLAWHNLQEAGTWRSSPPSSSDRAIATETLNTHGWRSPQGFLSRGFAAAVTAKASMPAAAPVDTLQVGHLYDATVKSVMKTKVILDVQNTPIIMHRSDISNEGVEDSTTVFQPGETIKMLVRGRHAIKGSYVCTRFLEPEPGMILKDKEAVWAAAEQQAAAFRANGEKKLVERDALFARLQVGQTVDAQVHVWAKTNRMVLLEGHKLRLSNKQGKEVEGDMTRPERGQTIQLRVLEKTSNNTPVLGALNSHEASTQ